MVNKQTKLPAEAEKLEFEKLHAEYVEYVRGLKIGWAVINRHRSDTCYEVMSAHEREEVKGIITRWGRYITPLAEAWWKERGWTIHWPEKNTEGCRFTKN